MRRHRMHVLKLALFIWVCVLPAAAEHEGDVLVGRSAGGQLKIDPHGCVPEHEYHTLYPVSGLLNGWADNSPGFDAVADDEPEHDLYRLQPGAQVWLEVVAMDAALRAIDAAFEIIDEPGEQTYLGDHTLHAHVTWHINSDDPLYDPGRCVWHATFLLRDAGSTGYAPSLPLSFRFTNEPMRPESQPATGDFNSDGYVAPDDFAALVVCFSGPDGAPAPNDPGITRCEVMCLNAFDFDNDRDVDLGDCAVFQAAFTGLAR